MMLQVVSQCDEFVSLNAGYLRRGEVIFWLSLS